MTNRRADSRIHNSTAHGKTRKTARDNRERAAAAKAAKKEQKPSILDNVKNFKPPEKEPAAVGVDQSKKKEESL
jgi:hypothetical protein